MGRSVSAPATTRGHCILSHGFESGPDATKVTALARVAESLGWTHERPDYTAFDAQRALGEHGDVPGRLAHLLGLARAASARGPVALAGSSLGAYVSGLASLQVPVAGLFLLAPPIRVGRPHPLDAAAVPTAIVHGWDDALIPAQHVIDWAHERRAALLLVDDGHRLERHVDAAAEAFGRLLARADGARGGSLAELK